MLNEDITSVKMLATPVVDKTREFTGIAKLKIDKKDRHMKTLQEFSKFLEVSNESLVQETLKLSRDLRETLEEKDLEFQKIYETLKDDKYLIVKSEAEILGLLKEYKQQIKRRSNIVEKYAADLDGTETKRTAETGAELKVLVDKLIAIAHALPDDIEHTVESEAFDINTEIINNRKAHTSIMGQHRIAQLKVEAETIQNWEVARLRWRQLRHDKALADFEGEITSETYFDPADRQEYMHSFQQSQLARAAAVKESLNVLLALNCQNIASEAVVEEQSNMAAINEHEISAIKDCYSSICLLRDGLNNAAKRRVEDLRMELHEYGALKLEPDLAGIAAILQKAVGDDSLSELWRLGGGLKTDFQAQIADMTCREVIYEHITSAMKARMELIVCSFPLKAIEEERGKAAQLDKVKTLITKMKSVPRSEVPGVLRTIVPELEDILSVETLPELFRTTVSVIVSEISVELTASDKRVATAGVTLGNALGSTTSLGATQKTVSIAPSATMKTAGRTGMSKSRKGDATQKDFGATAMSSLIDHSFIKAWNKTLGILFYGSDLPEEFQTACINALVAVTQQIECNSLVDAVVTQNSDKRLKTIDRKYNKHIQSIVNYLEVQATNMSVATANVADFYLSLAKVVEAHRKLQKELDDKSADEIWDLKEEFRFELEDREASYEGACQLIRESTKGEELQENFEKVLVILEEIQQSYRNYHSKACFASDKYPLMLLNEFYQHLQSLSSSFYLHPQLSHLIVSSYEALFDQTIRFNKKYFDEDARAAGFDRIALDPLPADLQQLLDNPATAADRTYFTSNIVNGEVSRENAFAGKLGLVLPHSDVLSKFRVESYFAPPDPNLVEDTADTDTPAVPSAYAAQLLKKEPHQLCPWMTAESAVLPLSATELEAFDEDEREEYNLAIAKGFINLDSTDPALPSAALATLSPEDLERYNATKELAAATKQKMAEEAEAAYILSHPPVDVHGTMWVKVIEVTDTELDSLWASIRESLFVSLEFEAFQRVRTAERLNDDRKTEYTDHLEEQIRNHWPRRGRVETQIKQPREAELLGHTEKTWRHIQNIQQKMIEAQDKFNLNLSSARNECDNYIHEMTALRNSLSGDSFKNLASLQGVDVKARGTTLGFQAACVTQVNVLSLIAEQETESIAAFARDFRKICPLQVAGVEGGYSQSEIDEIAELVEGQCVEIESIAQEWKIFILQLKEQQEQSTQCQEEFTTKYDKCVQDLAMSEGLGQKYGAPRRRAQERIRTEVSRDEQAAGIVDEILAKLEFICSEALLNAATRQQLGDNVDDNASFASSVAHSSVNNGSVNGNVPETNENTGKDELRTVTEAWGLLNELKNALQIRATYLNVVATPLQIPSSLPWMPAQRVALGDSEVVVRDFPLSSMTLEEMFGEVDALCRKETKELYDSEGRGAALGTAGIPDSLQLWLSESRNKILGRHGHREKAWKRYWGQVERSEALLARNLVENDVVAVSSSLDKYSTKLGVPAICMKYLAESFIVFAKKDRTSKVAAFAKLIAVWEKGREKHERLLRPKLGSPDMAEELNQLNNIELMRSSELVENVRKFRGGLVRALTEHLLRFCEDLAQCTKGIVLLMDSTMRLEVLQVPPDTTVPKKHMTMKKLRKAQRIQEAIAAGQEDRSQSRVWQAIDTEASERVIKGAEDMVPDLGSNPADLGAGNSPRAAAPVVDKKAAAAMKKQATAPVVAEVTPSLIPASWIAKLKENSEVSGRVGTSHRILMNERDAAVAKFTQFVSTCFDDIREDYDVVLRQENSWNERWKKQVDMLKSGNV